METKEQVIKGKKEVLETLHRVTINVYMTSEQIEEVQKLESLYEFHKDFSEHHLGQIYICTDCQLFIDQLKEKLGLTDEE